MTRFLAFLWLLIQMVAAVAFIGCIAAVPYFAFCLYFESWNPVDWRPWGRAIGMVFQVLWAFSLLNHLINNDD